MKTYQTFEEAFVNTIKEIISEPNNISPSRNGKMYEKLGYGFKVTDASSYKFENEQFGRIDYQYAEDFFNWMMGVGLTTEQFGDRYPTAKGFLAKPKSDNLPENFNTLYGPRIQRQLPQIIRELTVNENSRRAVISILNEEDLQLLDSVNDPNLEFPCADSCSFNVRDNKLHMHLHMRSNNMGNVAKIDMYLWGKLMHNISTTINIPVGEVTYTIVSAHVFENDFPYFGKSGMLSKTYDNCLSENKLTFNVLSKLTKNSIKKLSTNNNELYCIRHAKTKNNINRIYQGGELTANDDIDFDGTYKDFLALESNKNIFQQMTNIYCSTYKRSISTFASIRNLYFTLTEQKKFTYTEDKLLNEFNLGSKDGAKMDSITPNLTSLVLYLEKQQTKCHSKYDQYGESIIDLYTRIYLMIDTISNDMHGQQNEKILIVGHGIWLAGLQILLCRDSTFASAKPNNLYLHLVN